MKHNIDDATLQAAIDEACKDVHAKHRIDIGTNLVLDTNAMPGAWESEKHPRLDLLKAALARLPEPPPPEVDGKTPGQVAHELLIGIGRWGETSYRDEYERAASAVLAAFGGEWKARAEKAEAELVDAREEVENRREALLSAASQIDELKARADRWFNQAKAENGKYLAAVEEIARLQKDTLSTLRPIAEAGDVPAGCVRLFATRTSDEWVVSTDREGTDTHFADIRLPSEPATPICQTCEGSKEIPDYNATPLEPTKPCPDCQPAPDPYATLKAAHAAGKVIQYKNRNDSIWNDMRNPAWSEHQDCYRIKPEPDTFTAHGKLWTRHVPGDPMPKTSRPIEAIDQSNLAWRKTDDIDHAGFWEDADYFNPFIGWRYADEPALIATPQPWTPAVGEPVRLNSGGPQMTVMQLKGAECRAIWMHNGEVQSFTFFTACLQPVKEDAK